MADKKDKKLEPLDFNLINIAADKADEDRYEKPKEVHKEIISINNGVLGDIAPTVLNLMSIDIPKAMTGNPLV